MAVSPKSYSGIVDCFRKTVLDKGIGQLYQVCKTLRTIAVHAAYRLCTYDAPASE